MATDKPYSAGTVGMALVLYRSEETMIPLLRAAGRNDMAAEIIQANDKIVADPQFADAVQLARHLGFREE